MAIKYKIEKVGNTHRVYKWCSYLADAGWRRVRGHEAQRIIKGTKNKQLTLLLKKGGIKSYVY